MNSGSPAYERNLEEERKEGQTDSAPQLLRCRREPLGLLSAGGNLFLSGWANHIEPTRGTRRNKYEPACHLGQQNKICLYAFSLESYRRDSGIFGITKGG